MTRVPPDAKGMNSRSSVHLQNLAAALGHHPQNLISHSPESPLDVTSSFSHRGTNYMLALQGRIDYLFESYAAVLHPLSPVVDLDPVRNRLQRKDYLLDEGFAALVLSCIAMPLLVPNSTLHDPLKADEIIQESIRLHHSLDLGLSPNLDTLSTSMNIAAYARNRKGEAAAFLRTKEAHGIVELLGLNTIAGYARFQPEQRELALRMYWLLAAAERSNCLIYNHQVNLKGSFDWLAVALPSLTDIACRLRSSSRLYEVIDADIIRCITGVCGGNRSSEISTNHSPCALNTESVMQHRYALDASDLASEMLSPVQMADLHLTRQWLHAKLWQASVWGEGFGELSLNYPLARAAAAVDLLDLISPEAVRGNGKTMYMKLNNIADMANAVLTLPSSNESDALFSLYHDKAMRLRSFLADLEDNAWLRWES